MFSHNSAIIIDNLFMENGAKMRAYFFGNMYLSSIQQGIQAAHVVAEMFTKYNKQNHAAAEMPDYSSPICQQWNILNHWAEEHKTMVLLNAGYGEEIHKLVQFFEIPENPLPWAHFNEGKDALDGAITCVGIILPEEFYEAAKEIRSLTANNETPFLDKLESWWERQLAAQLNNYGLAR